MDTIQTFFFPHVYSCFIHILTNILIHPDTGLRAMTLLKAPPKILSLRELQMAKRMLKGQAMAPCQKELTALLNAMDREDSTQLMAIKAALAHCLRTSVSLSVSFKGRSNFYKMERSGLDKMQPSQRMMINADMYLECDKYFKYTFMSCKKEKCFEDEN